MLFSLQALTLTCGRMFINFPQSRPCLSWVCNAPIYIYGGASYQLQTLWSHAYSPTRPEQHENGFLLATSSGLPSAPLIIIWHSWPIKKHFTSSWTFSKFSPCWSERHTIDKPDIISNAKNRIWRSYSGGEYMSTEFSQYLISRGTVHQRSCAYE